MADHVLDFLDGLGLDTCDVLGFSLGGMIAQHMELERPSICRRTILFGTAPPSGDDIMHLEKPSLDRKSPLRRWRRFESGSNPAASLHGRLFQFHQLFTQ
ncbi:MAG TPA: alpha/beta hydrolase [Vicinamibacterales bacterium]|nr:alpha/beta hydrolase [Vicinamibacterales bacterium]